MKEANSNTPSPALWVCWETPSVSLSEKDYILSFLAPSDDLDCEVRFPGKVIRAREVFQTVQEGARKIYIDIVAQIGIAAFSKNKTFRQALVKSEGCSKWWFHPVSAKPCEHDPTFYYILSILAIVSIMQRQGFKRLILFGAPIEIYRILRKSFPGTEIQKKKRTLKFMLVLKSLAVRFSTALFELQNILASHLLISKQKVPFDIAFSSFWDWSVYFDKRTNAFEDRYYGHLPEEFSSQGSLSVGWFAWLSDHLYRLKTIRSYRDILKPLKSCNQIVILQRFITPWDLFMKLFDFGPLFCYFRIKKHPAFQKVFNYNRIDYFPLFREQLLKGFLDWSIPHGDLVSSAIAKALKVYTPSLCITFQEHFLHSRAVYSAMKRSNGNIPCYTTQHASYNRNKIYLFLDPATEFRGEPDGCAIPHPDKVFAMGSLGYNLFLECGYRKEDVYLTGSPRYDSLPSISQTNGSKNKKHLRGKKILRVLMVCTLDIPIEMDMVEAAYVASSGLEDFSLLLRSHPDLRIEDYPDFKRFADRIKVTNGTFQEDLEEADMILYTFTTVAEEAYLQGKPVWQWIPLGYNGSALAEVAKISQFSSVSALRKAFKEAIVSRETFLEDASDRSVVLEKLFYKDDGANAKRIASQCLKNIGIANTRLNQNSTKKKTEIL